MKKALSLIGACAVCATMFAQSNDYPWAVGVYGGRTEYCGEFGNHFFDFGRKSSSDGYNLFGSKFYGHGGVSVERYLNENFDAMFFGSFGYYGAEKDALEFESGHANANVNVKYKFPFIAKYRVHPFVYAGVGTRGLFDLEKPTKESSYVEEGWDFVLNGGLGIEVRLTEHWALRYMGSYGYGFADNHDKFEGGKAGDQQLLHSIGVVCQFPFKPKDTDKDGVPDKFDKCPDTPMAEYPEIKVDANGCPIDSDGDGVPDYLDKCPGTPKEAKVDANGCPIDSDGDGVADYLDQCPDTPEAARGKIDEKGCPLDSDGDGVPDYLDQCPNTPAAAIGKVDEKGCPIDSDGDGIADYEDACPTVAGIRENKGCPEVKEEVKQVFKKALNGIQFESGKATIKKASFGILNQIVDIMNENPAYKLNIAGHTDNTGKSDKNMQLSKDRAAAVKAYLANKGIDESRMASEGFGDTQPVADNKTAKGKALNRRVAFEVEF